MKPLDTVLKDLEEVKSELELQRGRSWEKVEDMLSALIAESFSTSFSPEQKQVILLSLRSAWNMGYSSGSEDTSMYLINKTGMTNILHQFELDMNVAKQDPTNN
jgi:hypothetical protein